jgi:hypothetical protein
MVLIMGDRVLRSGVRHRSGGSGGDKGDTLELGGVDLVRGVELGVVKLVRPVCKIDAGNPDADKSTVVTGPPVALHVSHKRPPLPRGSKNLMQRFCGHAVVVGVAHQLKEVLHHVADKARMRGRRPPVVKDALGLLLVIAHDVHVDDPENLLRNFRVPIDIRARTPPFFHP